MGGSKTSSPQQMAEHRGQQVSAASWLSRLKQTSARQQAAQPVSKSDLLKVQAQLKQEIDRSRSNRTTIGQAAGRGAKMMAKGFNDISRSLNTPYAPNNRPRISQLPQPSKSPMRQGFSLSNLQDPALRGRDITGRRVK